MSTFATTYKKIYSGNPDLFGKVAVLYGGTSAERSVSLQSGQAVLAALQHAGVDAFGIDIGENACQQIMTATFDRAFIALHGVGGEDGKIQALLDLLGVQYSGSDHASSALAMNKLHTKQVWQAHGLQTPPYMTLGGEASLETVLDTLGHVFVKPVHEGSSYGISPARSMEELARAADQAKKYDSVVIAEKLIRGEEYTVAILGDTVLPPILLHTDNDFYDFDAKYISNETTFVCPCPLDESDSGVLKSVAHRAFKTIGCHGWGRVDFMRNASGEFFLLEVNTVPGMTSHSLVPMAAKEAGLSFDALVLEILALSEGKLK